MVEDAYLRLPQIEHVAGQVVISQLIPCRTWGIHCEVTPSMPIASSRRSAAALSQRAPTAEKRQELGQVIPVGEDRIDREPSFRLQHLQEPLDILVHRFLRPQPHRRRNRCSPVSAAPRTLTAASVASGSGV